VVVTKCLGYHHWLVGHGGFKSGDPGVPASRDSLSLPLISAISGLKKPDSRDFLDTMGHNSI
jgi:hypothetical protein